MSNVPNVGESLRLRLSDLLDIDTGAVTTATVTFTLTGPAGAVSVGAVQHTVNTDDWWADAIPSDAGMHTAAVQAVTTGGVVFRASNRFLVSPWP